MGRETKPIARAGLTALVVIALVLGGCSGPATVANSPSDASSSSSTSTPPSTPPATPLTLAGSPPTSVTAGTPYSFQPTVSPSTAGVTFAVTQMPAWASFNSSTGALTGTPTVANVGTTSNITITASNSTTTASIGPFAITVDQAVAPPPATGSATLTWVAPTANTDGSILNTLAGFHVYYGTNANALTQEIDVPGATSTSYVVSGLAPGTYYFAVTAYSSSGTESADSNVGSKTI